MKEITEQEFISAPHKYLIGSVINEDFVTIKTKLGNAVLISEAEWDILVNAMKTVLVVTTK